MSASSTVRASARELIDITVDQSSFESWDCTPTDPDLGPQYRNLLSSARTRSGSDEAVITGKAGVGGHAVVLVVGNFDFLAGSIGIAAAHRIINAFERATAEGLPVLAAPASGGTRMQEGTIAFTRMINIVAAVSRHKSEGLPYLVYLRDPTTGGVFATWGSLGQITFAEPDALIGFLGPKVYRALHGEEFPSGVQTSENLFAHGLVDAVLDARHLRAMLIRVLDIIAPGAGGESPALAQKAHPEALADDDPWDSVLRSRISTRPGLRTLLRIAARDVIGLNGTGMGEKEKTLMVALARFGSHGVVIVGLDRHAESLYGPVGPGALRQARRGMALAYELGLPLVTVIDTAGAALSKEAEEGGLGGEIARSLADLINLPVPTVSVVLGQGAGGAAIALFPADRVIVTRHGWLAPLPPEGASVIRYGDTVDAPEMARAQGITSRSLWESQLVDVVVDEVDNNEEDPRALCVAVGQAIESEVAHAVRLHLSQTSRGARTARRARRATHPAQSLGDRRDGVAP